MSIFKKLSHLLAPSGAADAPAYWIIVQCNRCGETLRSRINLRNDLSINYGEDGGVTYFCRKTIIGEGHCFQRMEVELTFDANHRLINREIQGGTFSE